MNAGARICLLVIGLLVGFLFGFAVACRLYNKTLCPSHIQHSYTQGQIDYAKGKIVVELQPQPDKYVTTQPVGE